MRRIARADTIILALAGTILAGCGANEGGEQTFYFGWTVLGLIILGILVLFVGLVRYIRQGARKGPAAPQSADYEYHAPADDDDDPFRVD
jgi:hypothetical protein